MEFTINISAPGLVQAINSLAAAISGQKVVSQTTTDPMPAQQPALQQAGQQAGIHCVVPGAPHMKPNTGAGVVPTATPTVPTAPPQYTLEMIARAGTALVDAGKMDALCNLLAKYQVEALTALDSSQYGAFATDLRALGAQI